MRRTVTLILACMLLLAALAACSVTEVPEFSPVPSPVPSKEPIPMQAVSPSASPAATPEPAAIQSFFPMPSSAATPDPEYLNQLRKNAVDVNTDKEFADALETAYVIALKKDMTLSGECIYLSNINALIIDEGVTLTVKALNFYASCPIVNLGEIIIDGKGRMVFSNEPDYTYIGKISIKGRDARIVFNSRKIGADEIVYFLREDSLYNWLAIVASSSGDELVEILVDHDIIIPAGKTLWINISSVLHVPEGVTLTNNGQIRYYNEPIIEGTIDGTGKTVYDD